MPNQHFWDEFWKDRCVTLDEEEEEAGQDHDHGEVDEDDEYSVMIDNVIKASEAAAAEASERQ